MMDSRKRKRDSSEHLAGGRPWQWVFASLRAAAEPASLVSTVLLFSTSTILRSCCDLPSQESSCLSKMLNSLPGCLDRLLNNGQQVVEDVAFLLQAVSEKYLPIDSSEAARVCRLACNFTRRIFQRRQVEFTADSLLTMLRFVQGTITSASTVIAIQDLGEEGRTEAGRANVEAVAALGHLLLQAHKGGRFGMDDVAGHVLFLVRLVSYPVTLAPVRRSTASSSIGRHSNTYEVEVQRLTFVAIASLISQARPLVSEETWTITIQDGHIRCNGVLQSAHIVTFECSELLKPGLALRVILESIASKKTLVEDTVASRYYVDLLQCVYLVVSEPEWCLKEHVEAFVKVLQMFFRYGLSGSEGKASSSSTWQLSEEKDSRSTLDLGEEEENEPVQSVGEDVLTSDKAKFMSIVFSFDTDDESASENDAFFDRGSELRLCAINTIQAMARGDPECVNKRSAVLLLGNGTSDNIMQPRSSEDATLLTVLRSDPMPKVRAAAAATLAVMLASVRLPAAERKGKLGPSGFKKKLFVELQTGLVYVIRNEKHNGTLLAALKALSLYIITAPFSLLPAELLSDIVLSISKRLRESSSVLHQKVKIAKIACLKSALSISPPSTQLEVFLSDREAHSGSSRLTKQDAGSLLLDVIFQAQQPASTTAQAEATLEQVITNDAAHSLFFFTTWKYDSKNLCFCHLPGSQVRGFLFSLLTNLPVQTAMIELLDELFRFVSGCEVPRDASASR